MAAKKSSVDKDMGKETNETSGLLEKSLLALLLAFLCGAFYLHSTTTMLIGFMSDDYALMHSAKFGLPFWHLHYSPGLQVLWGYSARELMTPYVWHVGMMVVHGFNVGLLVILARQCGLKFSYALLTATFFALSPAGMEALAWACAAGYVLTMTWLLVGLVCFLFWKQQGFLSWWQGGILALMQIGALLTWEWGVLLFPMLGAFALSERWKGWKALMPIAACWLVGIVLRSFSGHEVFWQNNDLWAASQFFFGSPILGLFPNLDKSTYFSFYMICLLIVLLAWWGWKAWQHPTILSTLLLLRI